MSGWFFSTIFLLFVVVCLAFCLKNEENRIKDLKRWNGYLEDALKDEGGQTCCNCGKPYNALNEPDYTPELNLCRDCLWKMYYSVVFGEEDK